MVPDEDKQNKQEQNSNHEQNPERRLCEQAGALTAVRRIVRVFGLFRIVLLRFLTFGNARAAAFALASADRLDAALGLLRREAFQSRRQGQRQPADAVLIDFDPGTGIFRRDGNRSRFPSVLTVNPST